jgi:hypothetical protein
LCGTRRTELLLRLYSSFRGREGPVFLQEKASPAPRLEILSLEVTAVGIMGRTDDRAEKALKEE